MAKFTFEEQRVIIRFLHLRGMKPIEIYQQLSETCNDGVMDVKNVRSWVRQFKEGRTSCENKSTSRSEDMIARVEQMVMEDRRLTVKQSDFTVNKHLHTVASRWILLTLILRRSRTGTVWFYTSSSNKRAARPKLYTKSLTRDLKLTYSRLTLVRISINL